MRARSSSRSASGISTVNGRMCCLRRCVGSAGAADASLRCLLSHCVGLSSVRGYKPLERFSEEKDIGGSLGSRFRATSHVTRYAGQVLEPEETVRRG